MSSMFVDAAHHLMQLPIPETAHCLSNRQCTASAVLMHTRAKDIPPVGSEHCILFGAEP